MPQSKLVRAALVHRAIRHDDAFSPVQGITELMPGAHLGAHVEVPHRRVGGGVLRQRDESLDDGLGNLVFVFLGVARVVGLTAQPGFSFHQRIGGFVGHVSGFLAWKKGTVGAP